MELHFSAIITQMLIFAVLMAIGFCGAKLKLLTPDVLAGLSRVIVNVITPFMILTVVTNSSERSILAGSIPFLVLSFLLILALLVLGKFTAKWQGLTGSTANVHMAETAWGNSGFMGIPLLLAVIGEEAIIYQSIYSIADQFLLWTLAVYILAGGRGNDWRSTVKKLINPATCALVLAIIFVILDIKPQGAVWDSLTALGSAAMTLPMVYIGGMLAGVSVSIIGRHWKAMSLLVVLKMVLAPILVFALMTACGSLFSSTAIWTLTVLCACPAIVIISMLAQIYNSDYEYAAAAIFFTTVCSLFTMPLVFWVILHLF